MLNGTKQLSTHSEPGCSPLTATESSFPPSILLTSSHPPHSKSRFLPYSTPHQPLYSRLSSNSTGERRGKRGEINTSLPRRAAGFSRLAGAGCDKVSFLTASAGGVGHLCALHSGFWFYSTSVGSEVIRFAGAWRSETTSTSPEMYPIICCSHIT